ncbi:MULTISPECIES: hypothetical protein [Bacteria]|uniref:hypothetical protein n=1 Tax=Bacteria TaxID=2 RepID=UPI003C7A0A4E
MGLADKATHTAEELAGRAKRGLGTAMDDEELEARGEAEEAEADRERAIDKAIDAAEREQREEDEFGDRD